MSGRELDPDGTDSYHPEHPWEQVGHPRYLAPIERARTNWPPEPARPAGPYEAKQWRRLPAHPRRPRPRVETFGPGHTYPGTAHPPRAWTKRAGPTRAEIIGYCVGIPVLSAIIATVALVYG